MKIKIALFVSVLFLVLSCQKDEETQIFTIGSERVSCMVLLPRQCYAVKYNGTGDWIYMYETIEGFDYEAGYEYLIKVKVEEVKNPLEDDTGLRYILMEILSKVEKASENLPDTDWERPDTVRL